MSVGPERRNPSPHPSRKGRGDFDDVTVQQIPAPGPLIEDRAQLPKPPSPLAGEGEGEGSRGMAAAAQTRGQRLRTFAKAMRKAPTDAERVLWRLVRGHRLDGFKFRRQQPIGPYIADIACLERRLIVEADGAQHNESPRDMLRDAWLASQGFHVLRFWNHEILSSPQMIEDTIWRELHTKETQP